MSGSIPMFPFYCHFFRRFRRLGHGVHSPLLFYILECVLDGRYRFYAEQELATAEMKLCYRLAALLPVDHVIGKGMPAEDPRWQSTLLRARGMCSEKTQSHIFGPFPTSGFDLIVTDEPASIGEDRFAQTEGGRGWLLLLLNDSARKKKQARKLFPVSPYLCCVELECAMLYIYGRPFHIHHIKTYLPL